jgi:ADP-ribose pyrophosphatase
METEKYRGRYVRVTEEQGEGDNRPPYERVYLRTGVSIIPITADGNIRFIRERDRRLQTVHTKLVSGYVGDGEDPLACAKRELKEETGLEADLWQLFLRSKNEEATVQKVQYYYLVRTLRQGEPHPDPDESIEGVVDLTPAEVRQRTRAGEFGTTGTAFALWKLTEQLLARNS